MYARVTWLEVPKEKLGDDIAATDEIARRVESTPGGIGVYYLVNRDSGKTMAMTLWETEQAMHDSEDLSARVTEQRSAAASAMVLGQDRFEVVAQPSRVPAARA